MSLATDHATLAHSGNNTVICRVKWFDTVKGYGFLTPDDGGEDILLPINRLHRLGVDSVAPGTSITCRTEYIPRKGLRVTRIITIDVSTAIDPVALPQRTHVHVTAESDWERVTVKWFNTEHGYGFLIGGSCGKDIFIHMETVRRCRLTTISQHQVVQVRWGRGPNGFMAAEVRENRLR